MIILRWRQRMTAFTNLYFSDTEGANHPPYEEERERLTRSATRYTPRIRQSAQILPSVRCDIW